MTTRRPKTIHFWRGDLPHWQVEGGRYFLTIHLNGAIPQVAHDKLRKICDQFHFAHDQATSGCEDDQLKLTRLIFKELEYWLDKLPRVLHLQQRALCEMIVEAMENRERRQIWEILAYVIMPSHIHMFFDFDDERSLKHEIQEFKRWTGHQAAKINTKIASKRFWQTEWFDHWSRSDGEDDKIVRYIHKNPIKAGLVRQQEEYVFCK